MLGLRGATDPTGATGSAGSSGPQGPAGATGPTGATASITIGTTTTSAPGTSAMVTNFGTSSKRFLIFSSLDGKRIHRGVSTASNSVYAQCAVNSKTYNDELIKRPYNLFVFCYSIQQNSAKVNSTINKKSRTSLMIVRKRGILVGQPHASIQMK